jgi:hypothetical protein
MQVNAIPGILHLDFKSNTQNFVLNQPIPKQVMRLSHYRLEMSDQTTLEANNMIFISLPNLSVNGLIDNEDFILIGLALGSGSKIYHSPVYKSPVVMADDVQRVFVGSVFNSQGTLLSGLVRLNLFFDLEYTY